MKKTYTAAEIELILFAMQDIVTASLTGTYSGDQAQPGDNSGGFIIP
ncbi:MAG: hypothetical protein IJP98_01055 [Clostridia bacterium]|nr:hypothetical protein [Clostridia bacterium]